MIITIDGPAGTGKSTIASLLANRLNYAYYETGAMYRAFTWLALENNVDISDEKATAHLLKEFHYIIKKDHEGKVKYFIGETEITDAIRSEKVTNFVSEVSAKGYIRRALVPLQRKFAENKNIVVEGRDMGTVVFPDAPLKIFLTAKMKIRAQRRYEQLKRKYPKMASTIDFDTLLEEIRKRDEIDSNRAVSPLKCPDDAYVIDTSDLPIDEVVDKIVRKIPSKANCCFPPIFRLRPFYGFILVVTWIWMKLFYRHKLYGKEHFPKGAALIASNHVSMLDPPALAISFPEEIHFLAKDSLFKKFLLGWIIRKLNSHPVSRTGGDASTIKMITKLLKNDKKVLIFPEGTRSETGEVGEILPGTGFLGYISKSPILPVYIDGTYKIWPIKKRLPKLFGKITCVIGTPILFEEFSHLEKKEAIAQLSKQVTLSLQELKKWIEKGKKGSPP